MVQQTFQKKNIYKDFDISMSRHPLTNDVGVKNDINAINQSIRNLLYTNYYERPFQPMVGSNLRAILFEPADTITKNDLKQAITSIIGNYEPRVTLENLIIVDDPDRNSYRVTIVYKININQEPIELSVVLKRLR